MLLSFRDIFMIQLRVLAYIGNAGLSVAVFNTDSGVLFGCPQDFTSKDSSYLENLERVSLKLTNNFVCILFIVFNIYFGAAFSVYFIFPKELNMILKEYRNGWYSLFSYYMAFCLVDIVLHLTLTNLLSVPAFVFTGQYWEQEWRLYCFILICILVAVTSTSLGLFVSAFALKSPTSGVLIGCFVSFLLMLYSGYSEPH